MGNDNEACWTNPESVLRLKLLTDKRPHCIRCKYHKYGECALTGQPRAPNSAMDKHAAGRFCCWNFKWDQDP